MREPIAFSSKDYGADAGELSPTLRAAGHDESHANAGCPPAVVLDEVAHTLRGEGFDASEDGTGRGTPLVPIGFNLRGRDGGAMPELSDVASVRAADGGSSRTYVAVRLAVRRLTPRECERLQAWPDDHTLVGRRIKRVGNSWKITGGGKPAGGRTAVQAVRERRDVDGYGVDRCADSPVF